MAVEGMNYAPKGKPMPVVPKGEFKFAAMALDHGHIYGMCNGLIEAGAELKWVYDPDAVKVAEFIKEYPNVRAASCETQIFEDPEVRLIAAAAVPSERCPLGLRAMDAGKDYFTDKTPLVSLAQLEAVKLKIQETGRKYMVYYSERLHVECAVFAGQLVERGAIGQVIQTIGMGPHRLSAASRPQWFFEKEKYGGILCDIGSHQIEQFLYYTGASDATVVASQIANYAHPEYPELDDFGDALLLGDNGAAGYFRVDWFTSDGLSTWGDGRMILLGTEGTIEMRKYVDIARARTGDHLYLVNRDGESHFELEGKVGYPFFGQLILDCLDRGERAMTQAHALKAAELCVRAQMRAVKVV